MVPKSRELLSDCKSTQLKQLFGVAGCQEIAKSDIFSTGKKPRDINFIIYKMMRLDCTNLMSISAILFL